MCSYCRSNGRQVHISVYFSLSINQLQMGTHVAVILGCQALFALSRGVLVIIPINSLFRSYDLCIDLLTDAQTDRI